MKWCFNPYVLDTTPGVENTPFSPPTDWSGNDYAEWLRVRFKHDPWLRQWLGIVSRARRMNRLLTIHGPHKEALDAVIDKIAASGQKNKEEPK